MSEFAANREKTAKKPRGKPFEKGNKANPSGRPKLTAEKKDALESIRSLAPDAAEKLRDMIMDDETPHAARIKAIEIVLDRTYGKADAKVTVETQKADKLDDLRAYMASIKAADAT